ncbi:PIPO, partial [Pepper severe mosaic virus]|uniref:PIPO n=1 Tax=Pepper severe mosaic virus TaxID=12210 RepID=UPI00026514CB
KLSRRIRSCMARFNLAGKIAGNLVFAKAQALYCETFARHRQRRYEGLIRYITKCAFGKEFCCCQRRKMHYGTA